MTSEVKPGPPRVIDQMRSKDLSPPIRLRMMTVTVAGRASGRVMLQNVATARRAVDLGRLVSIPAGSRRCPPCRSPSRGRRPSRHRRAAIDSSARCGSVSQPGPLMPKRRQRLVDDAGGRVHQHCKGDADADASRPASGRTPRRADSRVPKICEVSSTASSRPSTTLAPEVMHAIDQGVDQALPEEVLVEELHIIVEADEGRGDRASNASG